MMHLAGRALRAVAILLALLVVAVTAIGLAHRPNTDIPADRVGEHVLVNGVPIRVFQQGSGRNVLLIHGSPGSIEDWTPVTDALSGSFRVTAFDRPGHGYSGDTGRYSHEDNAGVALALIDALALDHVVVVGHSYGGTTGLAMATRSPVTVDAVVVLDSAAYTPSREVDITLRLVGIPILGMGVATVMGPFVAPERIRAGLLGEFKGGPPPGFHRRASRQRVPPHDRGTAPPRNSRFDARSPTRDRSLPAARENGRRRARDSSRRERAERR